MTSYSYSAPVMWPAGVPRAKSRTWGPFKVTTSAVVADLETELARLRATNIAITTAAPTLRNGRPDHSVLDRSLKDPGVAVYLRRKGHDLVFALDAYQRPRDNLRAITLALQGIRSIERYGGPGFEDRALAGFAALPAQAGAAHWSVVLGLVDSYQAVTSVDGRRSLLPHVEAAYRELAKKHHPDRGGSHEAFVELGRALEEARKELR